MSYLVERYSERNGPISTTSRMRIILLLLMAIFASIHNTVSGIVWTTFFLALRPESQESIRNEYASITSQSPNQDNTETISVPTIKEAVLTDSFIREFLRMGGESFCVVR
ncbi:hypothetical protein GGI43DRAFT_257316 [Trichoderma evansii]